MARVCYLIFIFTSSVLALANCQQDLPPPSCSSFVSNSSCSQIIYGMIDCISFLSTGGAAPKPGAFCCSGFKSVLKADANCICQAIKDVPQMGIKLNMTRAVELPSDCGVSHFSVSKICGFSDSPGTPPAKLPNPSTKTTAPPPMKAPTPSPLPPSPLPPRKSAAPSPRTKTAPSPTPPAIKSPIPSPKSPVSSLPKSKSPVPYVPVVEGGLSLASAPAPTNIKSGSRSLSAGSAIVVSFCVIYLSFITV